ncbi:hypothetical protein HSISB1_523 [Streptococcus sp. HSISB1]|nr:hypothetical protein HSISB1_523 [Streptococcus sp. HSISB1]
MTTKFTDYVTSKGQTLAELSNEDIYVALLHYVKELAAQKPKTLQNAKFTTFQLSFLLVNFCQIT